MAVQLTAETSHTQRRHDRMIAAFARAASSIACEGSLQTVLDHLAEEARAVTGAHTCIVSLRSRLSDTFELLGAAGSPEQLRECLEQAGALGAPLSTQEVYRTGTPVISELDAVLLDPRFAPLAEIVRRSRWQTLVAVPLTVRGETVGALTIFYTAGYQPTPSDIRFLTAMADHGALAVHTAQLLAQAKDKAALEERAHMARDLHDAVSQLLFSMQLRARALQLEADRGTGDIAQLGAGLKELNVLISNAVDEMRTLILHLRPTELREHELVPALRRLADSVQARENVVVAVYAGHDIPPLTSSYEEHIFRITQEAIGNAVNHAGAQRISVSLTTESDSSGEVLVAEIADDGTGFDPDQPRPGHVGLANMRARCAELGGQLSIESSAQGTYIRAIVPLNDVGI